MKLARYGNIGNEKPGIIGSDGVLYDLSTHCRDINPELLADLSVLDSIDPDSLQEVKGSPRLGACVAGTGKFICIGLNYSDHAAETGLDVPSEPVIFMKATSAICGPNDKAILPRSSEKMDWEVELGVVIGKTAKYVNKEDVSDHIAGFCVINDYSERSFQDEREGQWTKGKSCDNFAPIGPWLVTKDEISNPQDLSMWLDVNAQRRQTGNTKTMVYDVNFLVSYLSQFMSLHPGDIISTGTPPGVGKGMKPQTYLKVGDIVTLGIDGLGEQRQEVVADNAS